MVHDSDPRFQAGWFQISSRLISAKCFLNSTVVGPVVPLRAPPISLLNASKVLSAISGSRDSSAQVRWR